MAAMLPGVIIPVPFAKTPVRAAEAPAAIDVGFATKLVMTGAAEFEFTVTVAVWVAGVPVEFVTVRV